MQDSETTVVEPNPFTERLATEELAKPKKPASILSQVARRKRRRPIFALLCGPPGIGKTTFASTMPDPVIIPVERGADQTTVDKLPTPKNTAELWQTVQALANEPHDWQSIAIDTIDAADILIRDKVIKEGGPECTSIEHYGKGYGKGYTRASEIWTGLLNTLSQMSERFNVLLIAHSGIKTINDDPMVSGAYDQHQIRIHDKSANVIRQMMDLILFANLDRTLVKDSPKARKGRAIISGDRLMWTQPTTGIEAKNRYNLESPMEFSWAALAEGIEKFYQS